MFFIYRQKPPKTCGSKMDTIRSRGQGKLLQMRQITEQTNMLIGKMKFEQFWLTKDHSDGRTFEFFMFQ